MPEQSLLEKLRRLPENKKKTIVWGAVIIFGLIGLATYNLWRTAPPKESSTSVISDIDTALSETDSEFSNLADESNEQLQDIQKQNDKRADFSTNLSENEFLLEKEQEINGVAFTLRKALIDVDKTILWIKIANRTQDTVEFDPSTNAEIEHQGLVYIPEELVNITLREEYGAEGHSEITEEIVLDQDERIEGYIKFETVPQTGRLVINFDNFLNRESRKKWGYVFELDIDQLRVEKDQ